MEKFYLCELRILMETTTQSDTFNKNDKQVYFNQCKGIIRELNDGDRFCSITLDVGHEGVRQANFVMKKKTFDDIKSAYAIKDRVNIKFYITSKFKNGRWYTTANLLEIQKTVDEQKK